MEESAFRGCGALTDARLSANLTELSDMVFCDCGSLTSLDIPEGVTAIGTRALTNTGLIRIVLPDSVVSVGKMAFAGSTQLTYVDFGQISSLGSLVVEGCDIHTHCLLQCVSLKRRFWGSYALSLF